jgi:hypothetical protein
MMNNSHSINSLELGSFHHKLKWMSIFGHIFRSLNGNNLRRFMPRYALSIGFEIAPLRLTKLKNLVILGSYIPSYLFLCGIVVMLI